MTDMMGVPSAQIPARLRDDGSPLLILGFQLNGQVLCVEQDGLLAYHDIHQLVTAWHYDPDIQVWVTDVATLEDLEIEAEAEVPSGGPDD